MFPKTTIVQIVKLRQKDNWVILSKRMVVYDVTPEANPLRQFLLSRRCDNIWISTVCFVSSELSD